MSRVKDFFNEVQKSLAKVETKVKFIDRYYRIANHVICFRFAGEALIPFISPAFEHLRIEENVTPELTIYLVDSKSTGVKPDLPVRLSNSTNELDEDVYGFFNPTGVINLIHFKKKVAMFWPESKEILPWWFIGSPLCRMIHILMKQRGKQLTHAGAVGDENGGILLAGKGGSGKSTTALACLEYGMKYVSEDYCLLDKSDNAYTVYNSAKITSNTLAMFPNLKKDIVNNNRKTDEKAFFFQNEIYPEKLLHQFPIRAVLLPKVANKDKTELKPVSSARGLLALAPSTILQLQNCEQATLSHFTSLLQNVPCYELLLGRDLRQIANVVKECIV